jgi:hypothetical protein
VYHESQVLHRATQQADYAHFFLLQVGHSSFVFLHPYRFKNTVVGRMKEKRAMKSLSDRLQIAFASGFRGI